MNKTFAGFTEAQKEVLAKRVGYNGPMQNFQNFLDSTPIANAKFQSYEKKAKALVEPSKMSTGGLVTGNGSGTASNAVTTTPPPATTTNPVMPPPVSGQNSVGQNLTSDMIRDPQSLVTNVETSSVVEDRNQIIDRNAGSVGPAHTATGATVNDTATANGVSNPGANTVVTDRVSQQVRDATRNMNAAQGAVSPEALAEAAQGRVTSNSTVQGQLIKLMRQFEGGETPAWAAGALRKANAIMGARGLGASSMAASASTQAAMESALEIAVRDAQTYATMDLRNLDNRQQAAMQNANAFLEMDMANLSNRQQMTMFKAQSRIQALFNDQAATNASRQFNATSRNQTDQFFAGLRVQVQQFNAAQVNSTRQFNVGERNATSQFNATVRNQREQFNAANRLIIDQSNAQWRRQITTINNQEANENNRLNAQSATGMTMAAYNNLMQRERDFYTFAFTAGENAAERANSLLVAQMQIDSGEDSARGEALGRIVGIGADLLGRMWG